MIRWLTESSLVILIVLAASVSPVDSNGTHAGHDDMSGEREPMACTVPVHLSEEAERKPGGALYDGPLPEEASSMGPEAMHKDHGGNMPKPTPDTTTKPAMVGAHSIHKGMYGGDFFMVRNNLHHLEALYSEGCGFQLFFYNAFTEPIRVQRFQAVLIVLPPEESEGARTVRFLVPSADGGYLHAPLTLNAGVSGTLYDAELYVEFPESNEAVHFELLLNAGVE